MFLIPYHLIPFISFIAFISLACSDLVDNQGNQVENQKATNKENQNFNVAYDCITATIDSNGKEWTYTVPFLNPNENEIWLTVSTKEIVNGQSIQDEFNDLILSKVGNNQYILANRIQVTLVDLPNRKSIEVDHFSMQLKAKAENGWCQTINLPNASNHQSSNPSAQDQDVPTIHFRFAGFIPCDVVGIPFSWIRRWSHYKGDHRSFDFQAAKNQSRASISALVSLTRIEAQTKWIGESQAFSSNQVMQTDSLCSTLLPHQTPGEIKTDPNYDHQVWHSIKFQEGDEVITNTRLRLHATDPIPYGPVPSLDAYVDILVWWKNQKPIDYQAKGVTDAFPNYELYVNGNPIYTFDALEANIGPFGLVGHEQPFSVERQAVLDFPTGLSP